MGENHVRFNQFEPHVVRRADALLAQMTLEEKVEILWEAFPNLPPDD